MQDLQKTNESWCVTMTSTEDPTPEQVGPDDEAQQVGSAAQTGEDQDDSDKEEKDENGPDTQGPVR